MKYANAFQAWRNLSIKFHPFMNMMLSNEFSSFYRHWRSKLVGFMTGIEILRRIFYSVW